MDKYAVLGLTNQCTLEDIRKAYHKMAHLHHPDKGGDVKKFVEVKEAYEYLMKHHGKVQQQVIYITFTTNATSSNIHFY